MRSPWEFFALAVVVTLTPGPGTAMILRVAGRHGTRVAMSAMLGNSVGVLLWGCLSAVGVSSLILASKVAYDVLRIGGAAVLIVLGARALSAHGQPPSQERMRKGWRAGLLTGVSNPKLAAFFVAVLPQFLRPDAPMLPVALAMALTIVFFDLLWFTALAAAVDRVGAIVGPRLHRNLAQASGAAMIAFGVKLAAETRS